MKLYFALRTRAVRVRWLLEELAVPYQLERVDPSNHAAPGLNPLGELPVLVDGDVTLFVASAICVYLSERYPERRLAPPLDSSDRGPFLQWLLFAETKLEPLALSAPPAGDPSEQEHRARIDQVLAVIDARLRGREFIATDSFTAADVVTASILHLAHGRGALGSYPQLFDYVLRLTSRPASLRAVRG